MMNKKKADRSLVRTNTLTFFVTDAEKERIEKAAQKRGMTNSTFGRMVINKYLEERGE
jgi:predicted DNA-binding protein